MPLRDIIDYQYLLGPGEQDVEVKREGQRFVVRLSLDGSESPGIEFADAVFDRVRVCRNKCPFCFVNQLPRGLRQPFYVKDDDFRLSFLYGNFVTLNNLEPGDINRIAEQRLSPLHVSVHATNPAFRARLMGCSVEMAAEGLEKLRRLGEAGIETHAQVVLCPGINDGAVLERTVAELTEKYRGVASVGVVPVALGSNHARKIAGEGFGPVAASDCESLVEAVAAWQEDFRARHGSGFVYAADEFYLMAGLPLPPEADYDGYPQYENGIGIAASFLEEGEGEIGRRLGAGGVAGGGRFSGEEPRGRVFLLSGALAEPVVAEVCRRLKDRRGGDFLPLAAENRLFGPHVTVTGLLGCRDIASAATAAGLASGDLLLIPPACTAAGSGKRFIDGMDLVQLSKTLACDVLALSR